MVPTKLRQSTEQTNMVFVVTQYTNCKIYTDLMGQFLILSRSGNRYVFIYYDKKINTILATKLKNISNSMIGVAFDRIINMFTKGRLNTDFQVLYKDLSILIKEKLYNWEFKFRSHQ